jgi:hypothetical protein
LTDCAMLLASLVWATFGAAPDSSRARTLEANFAAEGLHEVRISADEGGIVWKAGGSAIVVRVELAATHHHGKRADLAQVGLKDEIDDGVLKLETRSDVSGAYAERWTVTMPESLAARARLKEGDVRIEGFGHGVTLHLEVGDGTISVPKGDVEASVAVGDLDVSSDTAETPRAELRTNVGKVRLWVGGAELHHARSPGSGDHLALERSGGDRMQISSGVGDVKLRLR